MKQRAPFRSAGGLPTQRECWQESSWGCRPGFGRLASGVSLALVTLALCFARLGAWADPSGPLTWGATVDVGSGGWGRMIALTNGNWLCVSTLFPSGTKSHLAIYRSTDACRTWTLLSKVAEDRRTLDNGELVALPDGAVLLTMRSLVNGVSYRLPVYRSANRGQSWSHLSTVDGSEGLGSLGLWEPDFWVLDDGRLVVTYSNEKHGGYSQIISERVSTNHGATWSDEIWAVSQPGGGELRPGMSQMTRMGDGRYLLVYEVVGVGNADVYGKTSADGITWPGGLGTPIPCHHCAPFVTSLPDGRLLLTSCENQVSVSEDFAVSWQKITPPAWELGFAHTWPAVYGIRTNEVGVLVVHPTLKLRFGTLSAPPVWPNPFTQDFSGANDTLWTRYGGNFAFSDGRYLLNNTNTFGKALVGDGFWTDGTLEADVLIATPGNAGLMFRTTNPDDTGPDAALGYYVGLDTAGAVVLGRMSNAWKLLASAPATVPTNTWHHLRITIRGSNFGIYVDDMVQPKITWTDGTFRRGQIGVRAFRCNARFDNVTFTNAAPLRLGLQREGGQLRFSWPQNAWNLRLCVTADVESRIPWMPLTNQGALVDGEWRFSLPLPFVTRQFYRLEGP